MMRPDEHLGLGEAMNMKVRRSAKLFDQARLTAALLGPQKTFELELSGERLQNVKTRKLVGTNPLSLSLLVGTGGHF